MRSIFFNNKNTNPTTTSLMPGDHPQPSRAHRRHHHPGHQNESEDFQLVCKSDQRRQSDFRSAFSQLNASDDKRRLIVIKPATKRCQHLDVTASSSSSDDDKHRQADANHLQQAVVKWLLLFKNQSQINKVVSRSKVRSFHAENKKRNNCKVNNNTSSILFASMRRRQVPSETNNVGACNVIKRALLMHRHTTRKHSTTSIGLCRAKRQSNDIRDLAATTTTMHMYSKIWFLFVAILPFSVTLLLLLLPFLSTRSNLINCQEITKQQEFATEMSDLLTLSPPFAPTRRPKSVVIAPARRASAATNRLTLTAADKESNNNNKFVRANELDAFLDDMNHSELRTLASGKPIEELFHARPILQPMANNLLTGHDRQPYSGNKQTTTGDSGVGRNYDNLTSSMSGENSGQRERLSVAPRLTMTSGDSGNSGSGGGGLMGSHSEQQIYSECALILQRTYVKNIDDPKHQLVPFGKTEQACISYKHIDKAIEQAKHKLKFREFAKMREKPVETSPGKPPLAPLDVIHSTLEPPEDLVAAIGEINMATTQIIADQFDLSNDELLNGLPLIDMSKTKFWDICPLLVKQDLKCDLTRFRSFTAHCNNLKHPTWGAAMTPFARYLPPVHPDGIWIPRKSVVSEFTFDLGEGHRETHSSIEPSMPMPVFNSEEPDSANAMAAPPSHSISMHNNGGAPMPTAHMHMQHHHEAHMHAHAHHYEPSAMGANGDLHRLGMVAPPSPPMQPVESAFSDRFNPGFGAQDDSLDQAGSVQFERRAPLLSVAGAQAEHAYFEAIDTALEGDNSVHQVGPPPPNGASAHQASASVHFPSPVQHQPLASMHDNMLAHNKAPRAVAQELPPARLVTSIVHHDMDLPSHDLSILFMSWGQLLDHDMTRAAQPPSSIKCCPQADGTPASKHKLCLPIDVPPNDPFYAKFGVRCLEFRRTLAGVRPNCVLGPRVHQNAITSPIDANFVYGSSQTMADGLRLFQGGRLRDRDWFRREGLKPLLPAQDVEPDQDCIGRPRDLFCFLAGDVRANEQTHLTVLHTLYMREHNRLADKLAELNPHWDDERIYQEARHIVAAGVQHVMINEYIPLLIGHKMTELYNLTAQHPDHDQRAYWHGYDPSITTSVSNSFAAAAFRQGHTFIQGSIERFNKFHEFVAAEKLRFLFRQPFLLYQPGVLDELTSGMINQASQQYDPFISEDVSGHLFQPPELKFGHDLAAINLQRGREQGLPGYNLFREWCGLPRAETFEQLEPYLTNRTAYHYSRLYKHVDDIDLWSGGVSERKLPGAAIGPTFACIIARQFSNTRRGDRFWYENPGLPSSFTPDQLGELRKITLAKILCANSDDLPTIQQWAFRLAHPVLNPRVDCNQLPEMDLQYWQEE